MAEDYASAVRAGTMEAGRLHRELGTRDEVASQGGHVDVFAAIHALHIPLLLRPLNGLLGAYLNEPSPGVLVTTQRPMSVQRFTAAHELGHFRMGHKPSLDDENILRRTPNSPEPTSEFQETEADAFAIAFMIPKWLIHSHCQRQGWTAPDLAEPAVVYQLSLRLGASYEATARTLHRYRIVSRDVQDRLLARRRRDLKAALLNDYTPENYRGDVWLLTEKDAGTRIDGSHHDHFVLSLEERSGGGYLWDLDQLKASGFAVVRDERETRDTEGIGASVMRRVTAAASPERGTVSLAEKRPWDPGTLHTDLTFDFDFTGPEQEGLSRAERRHLLRAA